jgi:hypothetical protein
MNTYGLVVCLHVVVAILGLGSATGLALLATCADLPEELLSKVLRPLTVVFSWSLGLMLVTGVALDVLVGGGWHQSWWFRLSGLLLLVLGALTGGLRRIMRARGPSAAPIAKGLSWAMCLVVGVIAFLMEAKPW